MANIAKAIQQDLDDLQDEIEEYEHGLRRIMRLSPPHTIEIVQCDHCFTKWTESEYHPGTCANCGAVPENPLIRIVE